MLCVAAERCWVGSPGDFAEVVAADATSLADAGVVTIGVTDLADAGAPSLADAGILFPADLAGPDTVGVADLADTGAILGYRSRPP